MFFKRLVAAVMALFISAAPAEASLVLVCRKLYAQDLKEECFVERSVIEPNYPDKDFHRMYIGEIVACYKR